MSFSISGKTAIVTGAAHGIGLAIARHFAAAGANVMMADMDEEALIAEAGESAALEDGNLRWFAGDLREHLTRANLISATIDAFERIDILVNASRQILQTDPFDDEDNSVSALIEQNLICGYRLSVAVARRMKVQSEAQGDDAAEAGAIVNISSIAARRGQPALLAYSVSTAALDQATRALALNLAGDRIRVNAIAFGSVLSESLRTATESNEDLRDEIAQGTPLGRIAAPTELADAAQFLASDAAAFITGQVLTVDGGRTLADRVSVPAF